MDQRSFIRTQHTQLTLNGELKEDKEAAYSISSDELLITGLVAAKLAKLLDSADSHGHRSFLRQVWQRTSVSDLVDAAGR